MAADLHTHFPPRRGRTHEACGPAARAFACALAARLGGPVLWIRERWTGGTLNPLGFAVFADPARLLMAETRNQMETLATAEEALRSGVVPLVVIELSASLDLTPGRRLQLAARAGKSTGLCLIPDGAGSNAADTRWHCAPVFDPDPAQADSTLQHWEIIKNKTGTLTGWDVRWDAASRRIIVVSETGQRPGVEDTAG